MDSEPDIAAGFQSKRSGSVHLIEFDPQSARSVHGIARVHREVQNSHLQLVRIHQGRRQSGGGRDLDLDPRSERTGQKVAHPFHEQSDVHRTGRQRLLARKGQHPLGQRRTARHPLQCIVQKVPRARRVVLQPTRRQFNAGLDRHEEVVEVVGHASGQLTDHLQLLRLAQRLLRCAQFPLAGTPFLHVAPDRHNEVVIREHRPSIPSMAAVGAKNSDLEIGDDLAAEHVQPALLRQSAVFGVDELVEANPDEVRRHMP